jgi:CRISPR-associated endonuclease/helicase Cas3
MMTTPLWPDWLEEILWAKSAEKGAGGEAESLARHTWHVLEKLAEAIRLRPNLPMALGFRSLWNCLFWACFLHDFGKAARGFQERLRGGPKWPHRHEVLTLAFLDWISDALSHEERRWVAAAIVSHHKDADEIGLMYMDPTDPDDEPLTALVAEISEEALRGLWRWLNECPSSWIEALELGGVGIRVPTLPAEAEAVQGLREQGALRARSWLRTYRRWLKTLSNSDERSLVIGTLALRGHLVSADQMASAHTGGSPRPFAARPADLLIRLNIHESRLYDHQKACAATRGSAVLIAPTGSGKTESALLWACAQGDGTLPVPRLFYTLPYQASMNAMYDRLNSKAFPGQVGLEHSRSTLALYRRWLDEDYTPQQAARAARWGKNLAQLNYFPVRVLSPYQILKAPYRLKGYEALLSDFFDAAFILDEVHAYEAGRLAMILGTVRYLREQFGARFFVMSATLPGVLLARLAEALGEHSFIRATPELFARFRRHRLCQVDGDLLTDRWLAHIGEVAISGQSVLVCCNTVKRTQLVYEEMRRRLQGNAQIVLLHGRFNSKDRLDKERTIQAATGTQFSRRKPLVLVATQVVEVSLDIDLDVIYTDPAPLEALIQRFGRVNRRRLKDWAPVYVFTEPEDGQGVYEDHLVQAALKVLAKNADQMIEEEHISDWLDEIYQGPIAEQWNQRYQQAYEEFESACLLPLRAFNSSGKLEEEFYRAFDSVEVLPAALKPNYLILLEKDEPLEASQLLVPVRWRQFHKLQHEGRVERSNHPGGPIIVDAEYNSEFGLVL